MSQGGEEEVSGHAPLYLLSRAGTVDGDRCCLHRFLQRQFVPAYFFSSLYVGYIFYFREKGGVQKKRGISNSYLCVGAFVELRCS